MNIINISWKPLLRIVYLCDILIWLYKNTFCSKKSVIFANFVGLSERCRRTFTIFQSSHYKTTNHLYLADFQFKFWPWKFQQCVGLKIRISDILKCRIRWRELFRSLEDRIFIEALVHGLGTACQGSAFFFTKIQYLQQCLFLVD